MGPTKLFYVISHERSGTHYLINTILKNCIDIKTLHNIGEWFGPYDNHTRRFNHINEVNKSISSMKGIIKSHCDVKLFQSRYVALPVIYVVRDPRDVIVSWWHYLNNDLYYKYNPNVPDLRCPSISEFIRRPVSDFLRFCYSLRGAFTNVIERWASHVAGWDKADHVLIVRYEHLQLDFNKTIQIIAQHIGADLKEHLEPVKFGEGVSHLPRKGIIGDWKNWYGNPDLSLIDSVVQKYNIQKYYFNP
jgi:hypothetical protein